LLVPKKPADTDVVAGAKEKLLPELTKPAGTDVNDTDVTTGANKKLLPELRADTDVANNDVTAGVNDILPPVLTTPADTDFAVGAKEKLPLGLTKPDDIDVAGTDAAVVVKDRLPPVLTQSADTDVDNAIHKQNTDSVIETYETTHNIYLYPTTMRGMLKKQKLT